ncbi:MAG: hypothetical protein IH958_02520 [Chloroflexi bacterium]|nr:hypothetical protein [Chloroflexota bacterium]
MRKLVAAAVLVVAAITLVACGSSGSGDTPESTATQLPPAAASTPTAAERAYLAEIAAISNEIDGKVVGIDEALETSWPTRGRLFSVLGEAEINATFSAMLQRAEQLAPPESHRPDQEAYLQYLRQQVQLSEAFEEAIGDEDLVSTFLTISEFFLGRTRLLLQASPNFCEQLESGEAESGLCTSSQLPPGGAYGAELQTILRGYVAEFSPRVGVFPVAYTPEERFASLAALQPEIIAAIEEALGSFRALRAPEEFDAGHQRLIQYFEETLNVSRAISQAVDDEDDGAVSAEFARSGTVYCSARREFTPAFKPIIAFFFEGDPMACGGEPF